MTKIPGYGCETPLLSFYVDIGGFAMWAACLGVGGVFDGVGCEMIRDSYPLELLRMYDPMLITSCSVVFSPSM